MEELDSLGNGKQSLALNLKSLEAIDIIKGLIRASDVVIDPFRAGVMEKMGFNSEILLKENPMLVYARINGYGKSGPCSQKAGHDINYISLSGILSLFRRKHEKPIPPVTCISAFSGGGLMCALGIIVALLEREKSGRGQIIDANSVSGTAYLGSFLYRSKQIPTWGVKGGETILDSGAPFYEVYKTKDGKYIAVGAIEPQFYRELLNGLNILEEDAPQFDFKKSKNVFIKKFAEKTRDEWCKIFESSDVSVTPVLELDEAPKNVHNIEQNAFSTVNFPNPAPKLSRTPATSKSILKKPKIGEHTAEILKDIGYDTNRIINLEKKGVITCLHTSKL